MCPCSSLYWIRKGLGARGKQCPNPEYQAMLLQWTTAAEKAVFQYKADHEHVQAAGVLAKITTRSRAVELIALISGEVPIKVVLALWWWRSYTTKKGASQKKGGSAEEA